MLLRTDRYHLTMLLYGYPITSYLDIIQNITPFVEKNDDPPRTARHSYADSLP
jgi:hypothetical protein